MVDPIGACVEFHDGAGVRVYVGEQTVADDLGPARRRQA